MFLQILVNGFFNGCGYMLIGIGMTMVFGILNIINVAHAMFYTLGCYAFFSLSTKLGLGFAPSVILAIVLVAIFAFLVEKVIFKRLRTKGHIMQIIASNGLWIVLLDAIRIIWSADSITLSTPFDGLKSNLGGVVITTQRLTMVVAAALALSLVFLLLYKTRFGLMIRALPQDDMAAKINGINVNFVSSVTFAITCALAVLGAVTIGPLYTVIPNLGATYCNKVMAIIILGGIGSVSGAAIASISIGIVEALISGFVATGLENIVVFSILILTLIFKPTGLMGRKHI